MRTLPLRLAPVEGESLPSYIARYAVAYGIAPGNVVAALGLAGPDRFDGLRLSGAQAERVATATGIAPDRLRAMTLERYAGSAFSFAGASGKSRLPRSVLAQEVSIFSSRAYPVCLREGGAWLLRWQLGWSLLCPRHRVALIGACPKCGARLGPPRRARWHEELRDPCACHGRTGDRLCRAPLGRARAVSLAADAELVAAQRRLDRVLDGEDRPWIAGAEVQPLAYLRDLHALAVILRGYPDFATGRLPALLREAERQLDGHGRLLLSPAALAVTLPEALRLADLPDEAALAEGLREVADRRYLANGATLPRRRELRAPSALLARAFARAGQEASFANVSTRLGFDPHAHRRPADLDPRLEARHVPQLFWVEDFERSLAGLFDFDDFSARFARRFCSVLLARMLAPLGWEGAVTYLGFPERFHNDGYNTCLAKLRQSARFEELVARIKAAANERAEALVDYQERRELLVGWEGIDPGSWLLLQPVRRPQRWRADPPQRRAHASIWLWCELTSGHELASPVEFPGRGLHEHTIFERRFLPRLRERLEILGELLLATPAEGRATLPTQLAAALHERGHLAARFCLDAVDPFIGERVLAHVAAHTGVDPATLTRPTRGRHSPAAVTHARLLAAALLRRTGLASWGAIAGIVPGNPSRLADNDRAYRASMARDPALAEELEALVAKVRDWGSVPTVPGAPHGRRMRTIAEAIREKAAELLPSRDSIELRASALACREHTDLTWPEIAALHGARAHPTLFQNTIAERRADPDFDRRYRQLLTCAQELRREGGFANATLRRGLTTNSLPART